MISIIIVNWNSGEFLRSCIASIEQNNSNLVDAVVIVDNGSVDGSDGGNETFDNLKLIRAGVNLGFSEACNLGAQNSKSEYLLFLNPDAELHADTLPRVCAYMQDPVNTKVGICGVQLLHESGKVSRSCARLPSVAAFAAHSVGLSRVMPRLGSAMAEWDHTQTRPVDQVIGAFFWCGALCLSHCKASTSASSFISKKLISPIVPGKLAGAAFIWLTYRLFMQVAALRIR